jgi:glycosyltransferase involved in cell wall biosynthesis
LLVCIGKIANKEYFSRCKEFAQNNLNKSSIVWMSPQEDIVHYYNWADCFILPSVFEGCPNVMLEAMACGVPVIVSEDADRDNIVENERNGYRYKTGSIGHLVEKITAIYENKIEKEIFYKNNINKIKEQYSVDRLVKNMEELLLANIQQKKW